MFGDDDNDQQISPVTQEDPNGTHTPVTGGSKPLLSKSTKFSFVGLADTEKECKRDAYRRLKEMEKEIKRSKLKQTYILTTPWLLKKNLRKDKNPYMKNGQ